MGAMSAAALMGWDEYRKQYVTTTMMSITARQRSSNMNRNASGTDKMSYFLCMAR